MKLANLIAPVAAILALAACTASTEAAGPKDIYYATNEVAASMSADRIRYEEPNAATVGEDQRPFVLTYAGFAPASGEDVAVTTPGGNPRPPNHCFLCVYQDVCGPICCIGDPHCQIYAK